MVYLRFLIESGLAYAVAEGENRFGVVGITLRVALAISSRLQPTIDIFLSIQDCSRSRWS